MLISEKFDRKASSFAAPTLPFPYKSVEAFEGQRRTPIGRETNTDASFRDFTRPKVMRHAGATIDPIRYSKPKEPTGGKAGDKPGRRK